MKYKNLSPQSFRAYLTRADSILRSQYPSLLSGTAKVMKDEDGNISIQTKVAFGGQVRFTVMIPLEPRESIGLRTGGLYEMGPAEIIDKPTLTEEDIKSIASRALSHPLLMSQGIPDGLLAEMVGLLTGAFTGASGEAEVDDPSEGIPEPRAPRKRNKKATTKGG